MKINYQNRAGFTLVEMIATLLLSGVVLVFGALLLETSTKIFIDNKDAAEDSQKIQVAMNRLIKELTFAGAGTVVITGDRSISWVSSHPDRLGEAGSASWDGTAGSSLEYSSTGVQGSALLDNVSLFAVSAIGSSVTVTLKTRRPDGIAHTTTIHSRYD